MATGMESQKGRVIIKQIKRQNKIITGNKNEPENLKL